MSIIKSTIEIYRLSSLSYTKVVVITLIIYKVVSPNEKVIKTTEGYLNFGDIK